MLEPTVPIALYMEGASDSDIGKMGFGLLRYSPNPIVCVIDSAATVRDVAETGRTQRSAPVVPSVAQAVQMGAKAMVLGTAPSGGLIPSEWWPHIEAAIQGGMSIVNGLHDLIGPHFPSLAPGQWIWDIRVEPEGLVNGTASAATLEIPRLLMIGTDMAVGKMTAGLEILRAARERGIATEFVATGQIGIAITGHGVPLDAVRVDFASGAIEREVLAAAERLRASGHPASRSLIIIEGQGALIHPSSTANLPLLRGACPTHLILCARAGQQHLRSFEDIMIPSLRDYARMYEDLGEALGTFPRPKTVSVALNTSLLGPEESLAACAAIEAETGWPCVDPVRQGAQKLIDAIL